MRWIPIVAISIVLAFLLGAKIVYDYGDTKLPQTVQDKFSIQRETMQSIGDDSSIVCSVSLNWDTVYIYIVGFKPSIKVYMTTTKDDSIQSMTWRPR